MPPTFFEDGAIVKSVKLNSTAFEQGLRQGQIIISVDGRKISNSDDYIKIISEKFYLDKNEKITITTKDSEFIMFSNHAPEIIVSDVSKSNSFISSIVHSCISH